MQICAYYPYQGTDNVPCEHPSILSLSSVASLCWFAFPIPKHVPTTHVYDFSPPSSLIFQVAPSRFKPSQCSPASYSLILVFCEPMGIDGLASIFLSVSIQSGTSASHLFYLLPTSCCLAWLTLQQWRQRWYVLPKCQLTYTNMTYPIWQTYS